MNERDDINQPEEGMGAPEVGATEADVQNAVETAAVQQPAVGEPTQAMPTAEASQVQQPQQDQQVSPAGQPAQTQPMPPTGQPVPTQAMPVQNVPGAPAPGAVPVAAPAAVPSPTGALVCGILAIVLCFLPIVGIVLGIVAIIQAGKYFKAGGTQSQGKAGRICGIIGLVLSGIMIVVNCIAVFTTLAVLDDYDTAGRYSGSSYVSSSSDASSYSSSALADRYDEELYDVVDPELDKIKSADPAVVATIAGIVEESLNSELASQDITLADLKVDATELAKAMIQGFDYEYDFTDIDNDEGEAWYTITCKDTYSIATEFETQLSLLLSGDTSQYSTMEAAYEAIGRALMDAVNSTTPTDESIAEFDLTKTGDKWVLDSESWIDELDYLFAF